MPTKKQKAKQPTYQYPDRILGREPFTVTPRSGMVVTDEMKKILAQPGFIKNKAGGARLRTLYIDHSTGFNPSQDLSMFGQMCYYGCLGDAIKAVETKVAPALNGTETAYEAGYATIIVWGSQRVEGVGITPQHHEVLQYLISRGLPLNIPDVCGFTSVHHFMMNPRYEARHTPILELLLKSGGNPNAQDRHGSPPIFSAFEQNYIEGIELLMEYGADLNIAEADGYTPLNGYVKYGPKVAAIVQKCLRKRIGDSMPREEKRCEGCLTVDAPLKNCSRCHIARYCSVECQKKHWSTHKKICQAFADSDTVTVKPYYDTNMVFKSLSDSIRTVTGIPAEFTVRSTTIPKIPTMEPKNVVIKVQVPDSPVFEPAGSMLVYTKKREDLTCLVRRGDNVEAYDALYKAVKEKGVDGLKAYFSATIHSKDKLVVKISEVLAPQPF